MNPITRVANSITSKIAKLKGIDESDEKVSVLQYGLYVILSDIAKNIVLLVISYLMGLLPYAIFTYLVMGIQKSFFGGIHSKTFWGCLFTNTTIIIGISYLSTNVISSIPIQIYILTFLTCIFIIYHFAPADIASKPIRSSKLRKRLKFLSYLTCTIYMFAALFLKSSPFSVIIMLSMMINAFTILPIMYKVTKNQPGEFYA